MSYEEAPGTQWAPATLSPCPSHPGFLPALSSSPPPRAGQRAWSALAAGSRLEACLPACQAPSARVPRPLGPRHLLGGLGARPLASSPARAAGGLPEGGPTGVGGVGLAGAGAAGRRREEDAAPLRCHRRVAGKQLVPAPFRQAPLATRNTMHNNQALSWNCATRRGRGGAAGVAGASGSRPRPASGGRGSARNLRCSARPLRAPRGGPEPRRPRPRPARLPLPPGLRAPCKVHSH